MLKCCFQPPMDDVWCSTDTKFTSTPKRMLSVFQLHEKTPDWIEDDQVIDCAGCHGVFDVFLRKHHCRSCGKVYCSDCASVFECNYKLRIEKPTRCCITCLPKTRRDNEFYGKHLRVLEKGAIFEKVGYWTKKKIKLRFDKRMEIITYQDCTPPRGEICPVKCIELDKITDIMDRSAVKLSILCGKTVHTIAASDECTKQKWVDGLRSLLEVYHGAILQAQAVRAAQVHDENKKVMDSCHELYVIDEKRQQRQNQRLEQSKAQRDSIRTKYNLPSVA